MASWKKVIVSGSVAELSTVSASAFHIQPGQILSSPSSTILSGSFSGSFVGNGSNILGVVSSSYAVSSSFSSNAISATSASYAVSSSFASNATSANSASYALSASFASNASTSLSASYGATASYASNFTVENTLIAQTIVVQTISSSIEFVTGSTKFGSLLTNNHQFTGSVNVTGSLYVNDSSIITSAQTSSMSVTSASYALSSSFASNTNSASYALNASSATSASYASNADVLSNALTFSSGLIGGTFNGSTPVTTAISGANTLITNNTPKWTGTGFTNSNINDIGTQVQINSNATSGLSVAAGGVNITGNSIFNNDLTVAGNLIVNGTATLINSNNVYLKDQFVQLASGSTTLVDAGIIAQYNTAGSGSAFYLESISTGNYGRWAVAYDLTGTTTVVSNVDEFVVTTKINQASNPVAAPTWGGSENGSGNIWITNTGDIFIYA